MQKVIGTDALKLIMLGQVLALEGHPSCFIAGNKEAQTPHSVITTAPFQAVKDCIALVDMLF